VIAPARAGRAIADVMQQSRSELALQVQAKFLLVGPIMVLTDAITGQPVTSAQIREFCKWVSPLLKGQALEATLTPERDLIIEHLERMDQAIALSDVGGRTRRKWLTNAAFGGIKREALALLEVSQRLRALYP